MKKFISKSIFWELIGIIILFIFWFILSAVIENSIMIVPSPIETFKELVKILQKRYTYECLGWTLLRMLIAFLASFLMAVIFGIASSLSTKFQSVLKPFISFLKSVPTACVVFFFLVLVTAKFAPILVVMMISFPILYEAVLAGLKNVDNDVLDAAKLEKCSHLQMIFKIKFPLAIPYVIVGISSSFALSLKLEIMSEIITGDTKGGLGSAILAAQKNDPTNMAPIFAYAIIAIVFVFVLDGIKSITQALCEIPAT